MSDDELDAALDEALLRLSPSRAAAEVAEQLRMPRKRAYARALERSRVNRQAAEKRGRGAETLACWYLRLRGWRILARRARVPGGEVDVVARRGRTLAFVEVKARGDGRRSRLRARPVSSQTRRGCGGAARASLHARRRRRSDRCDVRHPRPLAEAPAKCLARVTKQLPRPRRSAMPLRVAVQMDALENINISGDSPFAIMLSAQQRGHKLYHYLADALTYEEGRLYAGAHEVSVQRVVGDHFRLGDFNILDLGRDVDVVLMRQDPPFDLGYITATHLLERIQDETLVFNDPAAVRNAPEKVWVLDFAQYMPPTVLTRSVGVARKFLQKHGEIVVKPLHGNAGKAVFKVGTDGANLAPLMELFNATYREPHVLQAFLPEVVEGDKRIVLIEGEVAGAINRRPGTGDSGRTSPPAESPNRATLRIPNARSARRWGPS